MIGTTITAASAPSNEPKPNQDLMTETKEVSLARRALKIEVMQISLRIRRR
jgi:hypothetical protein